MPQKTDPETILVWFIIVAVIIIFLSNKFFLRVESQFGWNEYRNQVRKLDILIIWIFLNLRRRKRSTFLLIGLGLADLLVGGLATPLFIAAFESASITAWRVFNLVDVFTSTSSIYALAVISMERMFAIGWPLRHRTANFRVYICAISIPWIIAAIFTVFTDANFNFITSDSVIYLLVLLLVTPLLVMCVAYYVIWRLPLQIFNMLVNLHVFPSFSHLQLTVFIVRVLQYSNSFVNLIIYPLRIPEFKNYLVHLLRSVVYSPSSF